MKIKSLTFALILLLPVGAFAQSGVTPANSVIVNKQTGTTYAVRADDRAKLVTFTNAAAIAVSLPLRSAGWYANFENRGAGTVTITPGSGTIDGAGTLALTTNQGVLIASDGTNWFTGARGKEVATGTGNVVGPGSATANDVPLLDTTGKILTDSGKGFSTDGTFGSNSDAKVPTEKAVKTYADTKQTALGFTPENLANKDAVSGYAGLDASTLLKAAEFPAFTGDATKPSGSLVTTVVKVNGNTPGGTCTNQFARSIDSSGRPTCATISLSADLGATTVGSNIFGATNPSAISFPKIAADNTVSFRTPAQVLSDILAAPLASPTFTGTVTIPTPFTIGAVSMTATGTELNFVAGVTSAIQTQLNAKQSTITFGTGVQTALGVNVGTAGAPVVNGGALGSPSSAGTIPAFTLGGTVAGGGNQINNVIIGTTTPLAGFFTTLSATGNFTPSQTNGIVGTTTNNNANAGSVGEYVSSSLATGSSVSLSTGTGATVTSISLTAGDWDVSGNVAFTFGATTSFTFIGGGISTTAATLGGVNNQFQFTTASSAPGSAIDMNWPTPTVRISIAGTTTVYLIAQANFSVSTLKAYGSIAARRVR